MGRVVRQSVVPTSLVLETLAKATGYSSPPRGRFVFFHDLRGGLNSPVYGFWDTWLLRIPMGSGVLVV